MLPDVSRGSALEPISQVHLEEMQLGLTIHVEMSCRLKENF